MAAAAADKVYVSNGAGSGTWQKITANQLTTTGNPFGAQLFYVREEQPAGTNGGTFTSGAWRTRVLNTVITNEISGASLASNQITLPAGTYFLDANAPASEVANHAIKWRNVTDGSDAVAGQAGYAWPGANHTSRITVRGRFIIASQKVFELQHSCSATAATVGFGSAANQGIGEIYSEVLIWKVL